MLSAYSQGLEIFYLSTTAQIFCVPRYDIYTIFSEVFRNFRLKNFLNFEIDNPVVGCLRGVPRGCKYWR